MPARTRARGADPPPPPASPRAERRPASRPAATQASAARASDPPPLATSATRRPPAAAGREHPGHVEQLGRGCRPGSRRSGASSASHACPPARSARRARVGPGRAAALHGHDRLGRATARGRCGRSCGGCRTTRGRAARPRCGRRPPSTAAGRWPTRRPCCRWPRTTRRRGRASPSGRGWPPPIVPDCDSTPTGPRRGSGVGEGGVQAHAGVGVDHAHAVGPEQAHAEAAGRSRSAALDSAGALGPASAKPAEMTTTALTRFRPHSSTTSGTSAGRDDDDGQVDLVRRRRGSAEARTPPTCVGLGFTGYTGPSKLVGQQVAEHGVAERAGLAAGADHRHRRGAQQQARPTRPRPAGPAPSSRPRPRPSARCRGSTSMTPSAKCAADLEPGLPEHPQHPPVRRAAPWR